MRALTIDELHTVSGGFTDDEPPTVVVVTGKRPDKPYADHVIIPPTINNPGTGTLPIQWQGPAIDFGLNLLAGLFAQLGADALEKALGSKSDLQKRDENTNFDANNKTEQTYWDKDGNAHTGYTDKTDGSFWTDLNHNGTYETHIKTIGNGVWLDKDNNGTFETIIWNNATGSVPHT